MMRKFVAAAIVATIAAAAPVRAAQASWKAPDVQRLRADVAHALASPVLRGAHVGLLITDTASGRVLYSRNADDEFQPASNFKLLAGSAALDRLGTDFAFFTAVASSGTLASGTLTGDLELGGDGDAHLTAANLDTAAGSLANLGITHVTGSLYLCAALPGARLPAGWDWDDLPYYYAPVVSGIPLEENVVHVFVSPGRTVGDAVTLRVAPESSAFTIDNQATTGPAKSTDTTDVERPWDQPRTIRIIGSYPLDAKESGDLQPAVPDPTSYAGDVFVRALQARGISIAGALQSRCFSSRGALRVLWRHHSQPMSRLLADFWQPSDNLMGEIFLNKLGGVRSERTWLRAIGVDPQTVSISDGSGLSNYDRITPRALVTILQHDWNGGHRSIVLNALPVAGVSGTLKDAYKGTAAEKNVIAKTGTISHVRTISGFIRTRRHGMLTFSFLINDWVQDDAPNGPELLAKLRGTLFSRIVKN